MDWLNMAQQGFRPVDFEVLVWGSGKSRSLQITYGDAKTISQRDLTTDQEWEDWLSEGPKPGTSPLLKALSVILGARANDNPKFPNPALVRYLPWSQAVFEGIIQRMFVNGSAARVIYQGDTAFFNRSYTTLKPDAIPAIVYNCRSLSAWPGDMALSATYIRSTHATYAIIYGCSPETIEDVTKRLRMAEKTVCHPMLLPGIFAELERKRHFERVENGLVKREQFVTNLLKNNMYDWKLRNDDEEDTSTQESVGLWMDICYLRNALKSWKHQLVAMVAHVDELSQTHFSSVSLESQADEDVQFNQTMRDAGTMIRDRLKEIIIEYEEKIQGCDLIMDGMTMATQLTHTKANMEIAMRTKRDGSQMKSIAFLTMIYLPATFVATLFSMSFFSWEPTNGESFVSHWFWVYVVVSLALTLITVGLWYFYAVRLRRQKRQPQWEEGGQYNEKEV